MTTPAPRGCSRNSLSSPGLGMDRQGPGQLQGLPGVILAEVDGLADVGLGLAPVFRGLQGLPGGQFVFAAAQLPGQFQEGRGPGLRPEPAQAGKARQAASRA